MSEPTKFKHECHEPNARQFLDWLRNRGGLKIWVSRDLAMAGQSWTTPALDAGGKAVGQPHWSTGSSPDKHITAVADVGVFTSALFKEIPVRLRACRAGLTFKLQDSSQRNLDRCMAACTRKHPGREVYWERGGVKIQDRPAMQVRYVTGVVSLCEWASEKGL